MSEYWVPKVHPLVRDAEADDPLELVATPVAGDPDVMLACIVQEFAGIGWDAAGLMHLFHSPVYPVLNQLLEYYGEEEVRQRIEALLERTGVFRIRESIADDPEPEDDELELIQVNLRRLTDV